MQRAHRVTSVAIALLLLICPSSHGSQPVVLSLDWEPACEGSAITVTSDAEKTIMVEAFAAHFAESREWICTYRGGVLASVVYRHYKNSRKPSGEEGAFTTQSVLDRIVVAAITDGRPTDLPDDLKKDFDEVMQKVAATKKTKP